MLQFRTTHYYIGLVNLGYNLITNEILVSKQQKITSMLKVGAQHKVSWFMSYISQLGKHTTQSREIWTQSHKPFLFSKKNVIHLI